MTTIFSISDKYGPDPFRTIRIGRAKFWWPFPIAAGLGGSGAIVFGFKAWGGSKSPILRAVFRTFSAIYHWQWRLRHRYQRKHQYNIIRTGLEPGYYDIDTLLLHGSMSLLCRYVEDEIGGEKELQERFDWLSDPAQWDPNAGGMESYHADKEQAALTIYRWWKYERPRDQAEHESLLHNLYGDGRVSWAETDNKSLLEMKFKPFDGDEVAMRERMKGLDEKIASDEQKMLHALIDIRGGLWI